MDVSEFLGRAWKVPSPKGQRRVSTQIFSQFPLVCVQFRHAAGRFYRVAQRLEFGGLAGILQ
jgi:hypothetical protein